MGSFEGANTRNVFEDDVTMVAGSIDETNKDCADDVAAILKDELNWPEIDIFGYIMLIIIILFIDASVAPDAIFAGFLSILFAFFFLLVGFQYRLGTDGYILWSIIHGYVVTSVGIYNRFMVFKTLGRSDFSYYYSQRELSLIKSCIGSEIFTLTTFMLVLAFEVVIASLNGTLRRSLKRCAAIREQFIV